MKLQDLPRFTISAITGQGGVSRLVGRFSIIAGVREGRSWLYDPVNPLIGDLEKLDLDTREAVFVAPFWTTVSPAQVGAALPWVDGYWQAYHLTMILNEASTWCRSVFSPTEAQYFSLNGVRGWQPAGHDLPPGATPLNVVAGAWDHEHCELCCNKIGEGGTPAGYIDSSNHWLCEECYQRYAEPRDLSFLVAH
jgi:hypothetical protein